MTNLTRPVSIASMIVRGIVDATIYVAGRIDAADVLPGYIYSGKITSLELFCNVDFATAISLWVEDANSNKFTVARQIKIFPDSTKRIDLMPYLSPSGEFNISENMRVGATSLYPDSIVVGQDLTFFGFAVEELYPTTQLAVETAQPTTWGTINGVLSNQSDLQLNLNSKMPIVAPGAAGNILKSDGTQWISSPP